MGSLEESYPAWAGDTKELRGMGFKDEEIARGYQLRVQDLSKMGFSVSEINTSLGEIKQPKSFLQEQVDDLSKLGTRVKELAVAPSQTMQRGFDQLAEAVGPAKEGGENRGLNVLYGLGNIALSPFTILGGLAKLGFGEPAVAAYETAAGRKADRKVPLPELDGWIGTVEEKELISMFGEVAGSTGVTGLLKATPGLASRLFAEVFGYGKPKEADNVKAFQKTLREIQADDLTTAQKTRVEALKKADEDISRWTEELTGKKGARVVEGSGDPQLDRFLDVEPARGRLGPEGIKPAPPPGAPAVDVMSEVRAAGPGAPDAGAPWRTGQAPDVPPYPRDVTPAVGRNDPVSIAEREFFERQQAEAQLQRATEGSDFMAEQYIGAKGRIRPEPTPPLVETPYGNMRAAGRRVDTTVDEIIPRGEGELPQYRQGPGYGGSRGRPLTREETPGGTAREPARRGLPSPDDPMAPPRMSESDMEAKAAQLLRENTAMREALKQQPKPAPPPKDVYTSPKEPPEVSAATVQELKRGLAEEKPVGVPKSPLTPEQQQMQAKVAPAVEAPPPGGAMSEAQALDFINGLRSAAKENLRAEGVKNPTARQISEYLNAHPEVTGAAPREAAPPRAKPPTVKEAAAVKEKLKQSRSTMTEFEAFQEVRQEAAVAEQLRPAIKVGDEIKAVGEPGTGHANIADLQTQAFDEYFANPKAQVESGWVDSKGRWFETKEAAVAADKGVLQLIKGSLDEIGQLGDLSPEQLAKKMQSRADRAELYERIRDIASRGNKTLIDAAADYGLSPMMFRRLAYEHTVDQAILSTGRLADDMRELNERAKIVVPEIDSIMSQGHLPKAAQNELREKAWGNKRPLTYDMRISQKMKDINSHQLADTQNKITEVVRQMVQHGDAVTAQEAGELAKELNALVKDMNLASNRRAKIASAYGRGLESFKHPPQNFPEDVMTRLREMGHKIESLTKLKERVPIATNIVQSFGRVFKERSWSALNDREQTAVLRDLIEHPRLNLFAPFSSVLDMTTNGLELGVQTATGLAGDIVHLAKGNRSMPSTAGLLRAIGLRREGNSWPKFTGRIPQPQLEDALGHTFGGEAIPGNLPVGELVNRPSQWAKGDVFQTGKQGVFTYRSNQASAAYDTLNGAIVYTKSSVDTAFKRIAGNAAIWREAYTEADKLGLRGVDRERFVDDFWANLPNKVLDQAVTEANKAGGSRPLTHMEERIARSPWMKLFGDPFARWSFQFGRWATEMIGAGVNPTVWRKFNQGTLGAEELTRHLTRSATGIGGVYLLDRYFNQNAEGYVDYQSGQWVDASTGERQRLSSLTPVMEALMVGQLIKAHYSFVMGEEGGFEDHLSKAQGAARFTSIPFLRMLYGDGGMLGGTMSQVYDGMKTGNWNRTRFYDEFVDAANRAIPGQSLLGALESLVDPQLREGFGSKLPGVSLLKPERIDMTTGEAIHPKQKYFGAEITAIGGTMLPGAKQVVQPIAGLLSRYGLFEYRGPRMPIAGYRGSEAPEEITREWQVEFGKARNKILGQVLPSVRAMEMKIPTEKLSPQNPEYESIRTMLQKYDAIAARHATAIVNSRHPAGRPARRPTVREQRSASEVQ